MTAISGSCLCGDIAYEGDVEIMNIINCHCDDCRHATGAAYATNIFVNENELTIKGTPKTYQHKSDRGSDMVKHFCENCGSQVYGTNSSREGIVVLRAGSIHQSEHTTAKVNVYTKRAFPSTHINPDCKNFEEMPG